MEPVAAAKVKYGVWGLIGGAKANVDALIAKNFSDRKNVGALGLNMQSAEEKKYK